MVSITTRPCITRPAHPSNRDRRVLFIHLALCLLPLNHDTSRLIFMMVTVFHLLPASHSSQRTMAAIRMRQGRWIKACQSCPMNATIKIITDLPAITAIVNVVADIVLMPDAILISEEGVKGKQYRMKIGVKPFLQSNGRSADPGILLDKQSKLASQLTNNPEHRNGSKANADPRQQESPP